MNIFWNDAIYFSKINVLKIEKVKKEFILGTQKNSIFSRIKFKKNLTQTILKFQIWKSVKMIWEYILSNECEEWLVFFFKFYYFVFKISV